MLGRNERVIIHHIIPTSRVKKVIELSFEESRQMGRNYVGTEHLLLGLLIEGEGIAARVLEDLSANLTNVRAEIERLLFTGMEEPGLPPERQAYKLGHRVLVHDPEPPHRLWEGRVTKAEGERHEISVPERSWGELVKAEMKLIQPVPMTWTRDCQLCKG